MVLQSRKLGIDTNFGLILLLGTAKNSQQNINERPQLAAPIFGTVIELGKKSPNHMPTIEIQNQETTKTKNLVSI